MSWNPEEGKITFIENGYRIEKVEVAHGWRKYTEGLLKFVFNHTPITKLKESKTRNNVILNFTL